MTDETRTDAPQDGPHEAVQGQPDSRMDDTPAAAAGDTPAAPADPAAAAPADPAADTPADAAADTPADAALDTPAGPAAAAPAGSAADGRSQDRREARANAPGGQDGSPAARRLEEEGDVAADYLEELLDIADLDGDIDIDVENGRASVSVVGDEASTVSLRRLAGHDGAVLDALQELTRLAVQAKTGERTRLMLDVAGFRAARKVELEAVARRAVEEVSTTGEPVRLEPMTPFERKVVHDVIAAAGLTSESEGVEPSRRVVVQPA